MAEIYIDVIVTNDVNLEIQKEIHFLVDTDASRAWIRSCDAKELKIVPVGEVPIELADGDIKYYPYGLCKFIYENEIVNGTVILGPDNIEPTAGTHLLQDFRLVIDLVHHTISRSKALKAK